MIFYPKRNKKDDRDRFDPDREYQVQVSPEILSAKFIKSDKKKSKDTEEIKKKGLCYRNIDYKKLKIAVILEVICLVIIFTLFLGIENRNNNPRTVAKRYAEALAGGEWEKAYTFLHHPKGKFLEPASYCAVKEKTDLKKISNTNIHEIEEGSSEDERTMEITFVNEAKEQQKFQITLQKKQNRSLFSFDTWKITEESEVYMGYKIYVPKGAQAVVDGIALTSKELDKESEPVSGMDTYSVNIFKGVHTLQISLPWFKVYTGDFNTFHTTAAEPESMQLTDEGKQAVTAKLQDVLKKMYNTAIAGGTFTNLKVLFSEEYQPAAEEYYQHFFDAMYADKEKKLNKVDFINFSCDAYYDNSEGLAEPVFTATMNFDYELEYTVAAKIPFFQKPDIETKQGQSYIQVTFVFEDGKYKIDSLELPDLMEM